jgi:hypothetical protein
MGLLIDYFAAPSDDDAVTVLEAGPGKRFPSLAGNGIEPVVALGKLEELLTGKTFDQQIADPASRPLIASGDDWSPVVIKLDDGFVRALAGADGLDGLAVPWSQTEELGGMADPMLLADFLRQFQDLARTASGKGCAVYCWICR